MDAALAKRIAVQDAEALEMLGVTFVPVKQKPQDQHSNLLPSAATTNLEQTPERARKQVLLDEIRVRYETDQPHQHFSTDHTNIVFGDGDPCARLVFVGEAPGAEEDKAGVPFVGRSGELLSKMIVAMGLSRETVYICNVLKVRPPNNATPTPEQAKLSAPYLYDQLRVIKPEAIVTLGLSATQLLLERTDSMRDMRAKWWDFPPPDGIHAPDGFDTPIPVMPTYHPAFLLRQNTKENKSKVWSDLKLVMSKLGLQQPAKAR